MSQPVLTITPIAPDDEILAPDEFYGVPSATLMPEAEQDWKSQQVMDDKPIGEEDIL